MSIGLYIERMDDAVDVQDVDACPVDAVDPVAFLERFDGEPSDDELFGGACVDDVLPADWDAGPDALGEVLEAETMMAVFAAQRLLRVERMHREALRGVPARYGAVSEIAERSVRLELAAALRMTETAAAALIRVACAVVERYPAVWASLAGARTTERHVQALVDVVDDVPEERREEVAEKAVRWAEELPYGTFRRRLNALAETVKAQTLLERYREAATRRRVFVEPAEDGMALIGALVPAVEAHAIHGRVTAIAKRLTAAEEETRTLDQTRADVFCDLLMDGATGHLTPAESGIRPTVMVTVPALALLHDTDARKAPATVEGIGPIPIDRARELCGGQREWTRILTHPETGIVLSVGRTRYRPPEPLRRLVQWRADRCMAPGCRVPASRCEIDHTVPWADGGQTTLNNHAPLCTGHHTLKHHGGWRVRQHPDRPGAIEWTSPTGRTYTVHPERHIPAFTPDSSPENPQDADPPEEFPF
ncbi:HNH endonuclease signature motif containing protein [Microbacterium sp. SORGH_AS_0888]|uniref:HNH endonuclease signature motif containing protein n=1 Tax=Microbacterium sp. SORGH_AS_0888 TaxID=3041791 RepID=UPI0027D8981E|nr:HNH endonuclease signature motif containing protein [Microbacterium sp. SORGH_AS_0888]